MVQDHSIRLRRLLHSSGKPSRRGWFSLDKQKDHLRLIGAGSAVTAAKTKKGHPADDPFPFLVEAAGVEPASASTLPLALHA